MSVCFFLVLYGEILRKERNSRPKVRSFCSLIKKRKNFSCKFSSCDTKKITHTRTHEKFVFLESFQDDSINHFFLVEDKKKQKVFFRVRNSLSSRGQEIKKNK